MQKALLFLLFVSVIYTQMALNRRPKHKSSNSAGNFTMSNLQDFEYYASLSFGTPQQTGVKIVFDTGSDQLWIADTSGYDYNSNKSSSANVTDQPGSLSYGSGAVSGYMGTELMFVPQLNLTNLTMSTLFASQMEDMGNQTDGLLGLGAADNIDFVQVAHSMGQLPDALFAFDLRNQDVATLFFAGSTSFPPNDQISKLHWMDTDWGTYKRWMITIKNTKVDGTTSHQELWNERAVIDTGTSLLLMGDNGAKLLMADSVIKSNCQYNSQQELYVCACGKNYPNIYFESGTKYEFVVVPDDYMIKLSGSGSYCVLGAIKSPLPIIEFPMMIFGDAFMRNYFVAYDKSKKQVGFSEPESTGTAKSFLQ